MSLIARALETSGLPTLCMSCLWEVSAAFKPPRTVFLDFPIGCPAGKPGEPALQREVLRAALEAAPSFGEPWRMHELPFQWAADGSRAWEEMVRDLYRREVSTVARHSADHRARGESLLGQEEAFTIRCHC